MNQKDIKATAIVIRNQHGSNAEEFAKQQIHYHRAKPAVAEAWKAVLAALRWQSDAAGIGYRKHG